jgi:VWFA-related protein
MRCRTHWLVVRTFRSAAGVAALGLLVRTATPAAQEPGSVFRSSVDVIAVDVQVVDDDGMPVAGLGPQHFRVSVEGDPRPIVSVDYIRSSDVDKTPISVGAWPTARNTRPPPPQAGPGRIYMLAFDVGNLSLGDSRQVARSALAFVDRLEPNDLVGMYSFPVGMALRPTVDRGALARALNQVVGSRARNERSSFNLSWSEIVDINAEGPAGVRWTLESVAERECPSDPDECTRQIESEARAIGRFLEARAIQSLNGLRALVQLLGGSPGRKTLVLFSAGIPTSDRPGGRPHVGELPRLLGQGAAATNTSIYTIYVDESELRSVSAETGEAVGGLSGIGRDAAIGSQVMEHFTEASGGAFMRAFTGPGEPALARVLRETSSHYLIGVEPLPSERDGRPRALEVGVALENVTVRSRAWVVVPER